MGVEKIDFQVEHGKVVASIAHDGEPVEGSYDAMNLADGKILLTSVEDSSPFQGLVIGNAGMLFQSLQGLMERDWSGTVVVSTSAGTKKIFLRQGEIVFAASSNMDDRLGEIIYREGFISLDDLTNTTIEVNRENKFGQLLIAKGVFSNSDLWLALVAQVKHIIRTIFMDASLSFEIHEGAPPAPTEIGFSESSSSFLESCFAYGTMFRDFKSTVSESSKFVVHNVEEASVLFKEETFAGDVYSLLKEHSQLEDVLSVSKLTHANTLAAILNLIKSGFCSIDNSLVIQRTESVMKNLSRLKSFVDSYQLLITEVRHGFESNRKDIPLEDIRKLMAVGFDNDSALFFIDTKGQLTPFSIELIFSQASSSAARRIWLERKLDSYTRFLLQITGDNLPWEDAKRIKSEYRNYSP